MFKFFNKNLSTGNFRVIAKKNLAAQKTVLESLRDYDRGKKDILITDVRKYLPDIRTTSR